MNIIKKRVTIGIYAKKEKTILLMVQRAVNGREYLVFPGGKVEKTDNSIESGMLRELFEELGHKPDKLELCLLSDDPILARTPKGVTIWLYLYLYKIESVSILFNKNNRFTKTEDIIDYRWLPLSEDIENYSKSIGIDLVGPVIKDVYTKFKNAILTADE